MYRLSHTLPDPEPVPAKICLWTPDLFSNTGGIQTFSGHFLKALTTNIPSAAIRVIVKNDLRDAVCNNNGFNHISGCGDWWLPFRTPYFASECLREAWRESPTLIISTHLNFGPLAQLSRKLTRAPYILIAHGIDVWQLDNHRRESALREADLVLAVSRYTRDQLVHRLGVELQNIELLPNTFSPDRFRQGPKSPRLLHKYGFESHTPVVLTVCRLAGAERYKGYDQMIKAMPQILREIPDARYLLVGAGPDCPRIERLTTDMGVRNAVVLAGFVADEELAEHYNLCDLFAMPSKGEGFGIVYLEALACGKPVLAGNKDGSTDALNDGELGLLVDPDNIDEIASETIRVLRREHSHPNLFQPELLRKRVTELFGFETFKQTVAERLKRFLDGRTNRHRICH